MAANTNVGTFAGKTWAMVEAGALVELTYELKLLAEMILRVRYPGRSQHIQKLTPCEMHTMVYASSVARSRSVCRRTDCKVQNRRCLCGYDDDARYVTDYVVIYDQR